MLRHPNTLCENLVRLFLTKGDFLDTPGAQGTHLISTEERARLRVAEVAQSVLQVGVDLNLHRARREKEVAGREGAPRGAL